MQQLTLDIFAATQARDAGMQTAIDHANAVCVNWEQKALLKLQQFLQTNPGNFFAEDVRAFAAMDDNFQLPYNARSWGSIFCKAAKQDMIRRVGYGVVRNVKAHATYASIWTKKMSQ